VKFQLQGVSLRRGSILTKAGSFVAIDHTRLSQEPLARRFPVGCHRSTETVSDGGPGSSKSDIFLREIFERGREKKSKKDRKKKKEKEGDRKRKRKTGV
jgi:hypothetical protein